MAPGRVSIIVPTYREAENLPRLMALLAEAMDASGWEWESIVVDDNSMDGTPAILADLARRQPRLRYLIRQGQRGLASAVLAGFKLARHEYLLVMDADLSHPPESIATLLEPLMKGRADFVIGSRYVPGGRTESWGFFRWLNSVTATWLSRPLIGPVRDPMAGFFALPRTVLATADELNPIGYKIALELMVKCRLQHILEVPIVFRNRTYGQSKLTLHEQFRYLEHLARLYDYRFPRVSRWVKFLIAAGCGVLAGWVMVVGLGYWRTLSVGWSLAAGLGVMPLVTVVFFILLSWHRR
jgi:dolichol-phosphate mannosyltransferase